MTTLPEEAVKAAVEAVDEGVNWVAGLFGEKYDNAEEVMRSALTAALPFLPVQVAVKKMAWIRPPLSDTLSRCDTDFGTYRTWTHDEANGKWFWSVEGGWNEANGEAPNEEAAKAAAQADYEARILSALETSAARELALEEIISELVDAQHKCFEWTGSAFLADELDAIEDAECKAAIYKDLCALGNTMSWLQDQVRALSSPYHADAGKVEGDGCKRCGGKGEKLEADNASKDREIERLTKSLIIEEQLNAALTARIKELTSPEYLTEKLVQVGVVDKEWRDRAQALEAKLAAARSALTMIAKIELSFPEELRDIARAALGGKPS